MISTKVEESLTNASTKYGFNFVEEKPGSNENRTVDWFRVPNEIECQQEDKAVK